MPAQLEIKIKGINKREKFCQYGKTYRTEWKKEEEKPDIPSVYDESEDFDTELEEDLALLGEPDEDW